MLERQRVVAVSGVAVAAVAGLAVGAGNVADGASSRSCGPASAATVVSSSVARIYTPDRARGPAPNGLQFPRLYGCLFGGRRIVSLGGGGRQQVLLPTLAGRFAGYGLRAMGVDTDRSSVRVVDLRSGRVIDDTAATRPARRPESITNVAALVLNAHGQVAWVGVQSSFLGPRGATYEVHKIDGPAEALLDAGPQIDPGSLRRHGRRISWRNGGQVRTAALG